MLASNLRAFQQRATGKLVGHNVDLRLRDESEWARDFVNLRKPRELRAGVGCRKLVIKTQSFHLDFSSCATRFFWRSFIDWGHDLSNQILQALRNGFGVS